jgi:hypothetical protein
MGIQQSNMNNKTPNIKLETKEYRLTDRSIVCLESTIDKSRNKHSRNRNTDKEYVIYHDKHRQKFASLTIRIKDGTIYLYLSVNGSKQKLIHISNLGSAYDEALVETVTISNDMMYMVLPEVDPESKDISLSVFSLNDLFKNGRLIHVKSISCDPVFTITRIVGSVLHLINRKTFSEIQSIDFLEGISSILVCKDFEIEKIRFSPNGRNILLYGNKCIRIYSFRDNQYEWVHKTKLVNKDFLSLIECVITDTLNIYYVLKSDDDVIYYCVCRVMTNNISHKIPLDKRAGGNVQPFQLFLINGNDYRSLFVPDLDFYSSNGELVKVRNIIVLGEFTANGIALRIFAEMEEVENDSSMGFISLLGTHRIDFSSGINRNNMKWMYSHIIHDNDGEITIYDVKKVLSVLIATDLSQLIKTQINTQIRKNIGNIINKLKITSETPTLRSNVIIKGADDREVKYDVSEPIIKYSMLISDINDLAASNTASKSDESVYQMTVNSNMTLMSTKSFFIFEDMLLDRLQPSELIDLIFSSYRDSTYDRYQTVLEILDHFYDYTKYILLNITTDHSSSYDNETGHISEFDQIFNMFKKRVALLVAYMSVAIVFDYYNRECDLPQGVNTLNADDYQVTREISDNFHHNFQPFKDAIHYHLDRMEVIGQ